MKFDFKEYHEIEQTLINIVKDITEDSAIRDWAKNMVMRLLSKLDDNKVREILVNNRFTDEFKIKLEDTIHYLENIQDNERVKQLRGNFEQVSSNADKWIKTTQKKGASLENKPEEGLETVYKFRDGWRMVKLTNKDQCTREGTLMGHCVGGYDPKRVNLISLRDKENNPHVTLEITLKGDVKQIKGKENRAPIAKYVRYVKEYLGANPDFNIIGDGENIGYVRYDNKYYDPDSTKWKDVYDNTITPLQNKRLEELRTMMA